MEIINVCLAANNNYAMQTGVALVSLLENIGTSKTRVFILQNDFSDENISRFKLIEGKYNTIIKMINPSKVFDKINKLAFMNVVAENGEEYAKKMGAAAYARLFITELIPVEIDKILYIDSDVIVHSNIEKLYNSTIHKGIGAIIDVWPNIYNKHIGMKQNDVYYSAGVQLMDLQYMRSNGYQERIWSFMKSMNHQYRLFDQDIMNILFHDTITKLPLEYNMMGPSRFYSIDLIWKLTGKDINTYYTNEEQKHAFNNPVIYHFAGDLFGKPWNAPFINKYTKEWYSYYKKTPWATNKIYVNLNISFSDYYKRFFKLSVKKYIYFLKGYSVYYEKQVTKMIEDASHK